MNDDQMHERLRKWAAQQLDTPIVNVVNVETDWQPLCDTCEFSEGDITVTLGDGRTYHGKSQFGLFLRDIVEMDLDEDGGLTRSAYGRKPFELSLVEGGR